VGPLQFCHSRCAAVNCRHPDLTPPHSARHHTPQAGLKAVKWLIRLVHCKAEAQRRLDHGGLEEKLEGKERRAVRAVQEAFKVRPGGSAR